MVVRSLTPEYWSTYTDEVAHEIATARVSTGSRPGQTVSKYPSVPEPGLDELIDDLVNGEIGLVAMKSDRGSVGHIYVVNGATFSMAAKGFWSSHRYFVRELRVLDPRTGGAALFHDDLGMERVDFAMGRTSAAAWVAKTLRTYRK